MDEVSDIGQGLQRDLGAVEGATARRAARLQLLGTALFAFGLRLVRILAATRLVEHFLDGGRQRAHSPLLNNGGLMQNESLSWSFRLWSVRPSLAGIAGGGRKVVSALSE